MRELLQYVVLAIALGVCLWMVVAGEETVVQVPEWNVCFDFGRAPHFALTSDIVCLSHGHMDHVAGVGYFLSQRFFQGMKPATVLTLALLTAMLWVAALAPEHK